MTYQVRAGGLSRGAVCKIVRCVRGLTTTEVAKAAGVNSSTVSRFENDEFSNTKLCEFYESLLGKGLVPSVPVEKFEQNVGVSVMIWQEEE